MTETMKLPFGKTKIRPRQIKKALVITLYAFVAVVTVVGMVGPMLQQ